MSIIQLNPPIPLCTSKGDGVAHFVIDYGFHEHHLIWIVALDSNGQCWGFENPDIRFTTNYTLKRGKDLDFFAPRVLEQPKPLPKPTLWQRLKRLFGSQQPAG